MFTIYLRFNLKNLGGGVDFQVRGVGKKGGLRGKLVKAIAEQVWDEI
jgi:hypothetical protein